MPTPSRPISEEAYQKRLREVIDRLDTPGPGPRPPGRCVVQHFKGQFYEVTGFATNATTERLVIMYKKPGGDPSLYVRDYEDFFGEVQVAGLWGPRFRVWG